LIWFVKDGGNMPDRRLMSLALILAFILSSCASSAKTSEAEMEMVEDTSVETTGDLPQEPPNNDLAEEMGSDKAVTEEEIMVPGWFSVPLVDVHTDATFSIEDFRGQVVLVETMAVWCSNCLRQQREVQALHAALGDRQDFRSIALDIDPYEDAGILRDFAVKNGFDWHYAVAPSALANQLGTLYGQQFLNPPSTPILLIDRHGVVHPLPFGIKSTGDLQNSVESLLEGEM
jgi:hypothetical protein